MSKSVFSLTPAQTFLLPFLLCAGVLWFFLTINMAMGNTLLTFVVVTWTGLWLCNQTKLALADPKLKILGTFWLVKVSITIFLLYAGWIPDLDPVSSPRWGYDPQRYFQDAYVLIENGWNPLNRINYQGIIYYYAGIFYLFGRNPVIPALINAFVTLLSTLFLIRAAYEFKSIRGKHDWLIAYLLLIPEVLWYDVMTSRETLMASLIIFATLAAGRYLVGVRKGKLSTTFLLSGASLFAILAVRTTMVIPVVASICTMALMLRSRRKMSMVTKVLLVMLCIAAFSAGPFIQGLIGGYEFDYYRISLTHIYSLEYNIAASGGWSDRSLGLLLAPNNIWQWCLSLLPRMVLYLVAPLPKLSVPFTELTGGSWSAWQQLMTVLSSVAILLGFPYVLADAKRSWQQRRQSPPLFLHITFWTIFIAVAGGNVCIHERYRVMMTLLLFACVWQGYTSCTRVQVYRYAFLWYGLLSAGAAFYVAYKVL